MTRRNALAIPITALGLVFLAAVVASAQVPQASMTISHPIGFAVSQPQSRIGPAAPISVLPSLQTAIPVRRTGPAGMLAPTVPDPVLQTSVGALLDEDHKRKAKNNRSKSACTLI
jgi:hypothetical protein